MQVLGVQVPLVVVLVVALVVLALVAALLDLARHEVQHLPKWAWALVIILVSFPLGVPAVRRARTPAPG